MIKKCRGVTRNVVANVLDCNSVVSQFEFQSCYYDHFGTNSLRKGTNH